jgi:hypothetical protein
VSSRGHNLKRLALLERRKKVAARYLRGQTQWEIARAFEVEQATISNDLKAIHAEWLKEATLDRGEWTARELARIDEVERQAWAAWAKSQEDAEVLRAKRRGDVAETEKIIKGQSGDPCFLDIILKCIERRCGLLGLDAPKQLEFTERQSITLVEVIRQPTDGDHGSSAGVQRKTCR